MRDEAGSTGGRETPEAAEDRASIDHLLRIMARLRDPEHGCPWDIEQTFATIAPYTLEEAYEVADAIGRSDFLDLRDELGDLLLQVVFHARMAEEAGRFDFDDVVAAICDKMVRRHPHVFADAHVRDATVVRQRWEEIKADEKDQRSQRENSKYRDLPSGGLLDDVPLALPALQRAQKLQKRAATVGFDWTDCADVIAKIHEEVDELVGAQALRRPDAIEEEIGDLLFAITNLARHLGVDAEAATRRSNDKFVRRFRFIEEAVAREGVSLKSVTLDRMEELWQSAKRHERSRQSP